MDYLDYSEVFSSWFVWVKRIIFFGLNHISFFFPPLTVVDWPLKLNVVHADFQMSLLWIYNK